MLLASVLILKICFGQSLYSAVSIKESKTSIHAFNSIQNISLTITNSEFDEDENEKNNTEDLFVELHYLSVLFNQIPFSNNSFLVANIYNNLPSNIPIFKAINCFRI